MKRLLFIVLAVLLAGIAYLVLWPVPVKPQSWNAPVSTGYVGEYAPNEQLKNLDLIPLAPHHGPEDAAARLVDGHLRIFVAVHDGNILQIDPEARTSQVFAKTNGRPLGLEFDKDNNLIVADAYRGILSVSPDGKVTVLTDTADDGSPIRYADDLDVASDGRIFFSDASTRFGAKEAKGTLQGSLLALMEHSNDGRLMVYDPKDGTTSTVLDGLTFPNGVAMCPEDICVLLNETGTYAVKRVWLDGSKAKKVDNLFENLPGFPDNLNRAPDGSFWLGLASPRSSALDKLSAKPFLRKVVQRLPAAMRPKAQNYGFVMNFSLDGHIINMLQDPSGAYPVTTGVLDAGDGWLYITSLSAKSLGRKGWPKAPAATPEETPEEAPAEAPTEG